jgi:hypothetical protein
MKRTRGSEPSTEEVNGARTRGAKEGGRGAKPAAKKPAKPGSKPAKGASPTRKARSAAGVLGGLVAGGDSIKEIDPGYYILKQVKNNVLVRVGELYVTLANEEHWGLYTMAGREYVNPRPIPGETSVLVIEAVGKVGGDKVPGDVKEFVERYLRVNDPKAKYIIARCEEQPPP